VRLLREDGGTGDAMTRDEILAANPLKDFLPSAGVVLRGDRSKTCPRKTHEGFDVSVDFGKNVWKCHACGIGGSFLDWIAERDNVPVADVLRKYGSNCHGAHQRNDPPPANLSATWRKCVDGFTDEHAAKLAEWRGLSPEFVAWLRQRELVGVHQGNLALPVHGDGGAVVAFHVRAKDGGWFYHPKGAKTCPLVLGDPKAADVVLVFESQWDAFAVLDKSPNWTKDQTSPSIVTRGAGNGKLVRGLVKRGAVLLAFKQNDEAAAKWLADVTAAATADGVTVKLVATPELHKDCNDWTRAGATGADVNAAIEAATDVAEVVTPSQVETPKADTEGHTSAKIETALVSTVELASMELEPREFVLRPFWKAGDLGFIYGKRGDGKTWLGMEMAKAITTGTSAGPWTADKPWTVLYVDGEMPAEESKRRIVELGGKGENLLWLHHEIYFERTGKTLNLADAATQQELTALMQVRGVRVLFLDNLSCLFSGVKENDADSWEQVLPWLLQLRRLKIAVVIVAHAGRSGQNIRGTSRREDAAFWVLKLERNESDDPQFRGLRFSSLFTKNRNALEDDCPPLEWTFTSEQDGKITVTAKSISGVELLVSWVRAGLDSATDIAEEMGVSKGTVSKLAKKAERLGEIVIEGRCYRATKDVK
jgi:hypothetical protein